MIKLEDLKPGMLVQGLAPSQTVKLLMVQPIGSNAIRLIYETSDGRVDEAFRYREDIANLRIVQTKHDWRFDGEGYTFRLVSEAFRIHLAHLFDPILAVHTSLIEPLPHQITAVYEEMLTRYPLRFLLADDPGAGKTVMAGLLIRELMVRGDVRRCLICVPGKLTRQWKDELWDKFRLEFDVVEGSADINGNNPFKRQDQLIVSVDRAKRKERMAQLQKVAWDLVICDEAHQLSAHLIGSKTNKTQRYRLGELLGKRTRHLLFLTATPHNGREEDFQLFLRLLDEQRFGANGSPEQRLYGLNHVDAAALMRRMVKEELRRFDGKPLFPERKAYTVNYDLSGKEQRLYEAVSAYIRDEFDRADKLENPQAKYSLGFAMTVLQRRLASSPEAIYQSLSSRRNRLETRLETDGLHNRWRPSKRLEETEDEIENLPADRIEALENEYAASSTAAQNLRELLAEIETLRKLESQALDVCRGGQDKKWEEMRDLFGIPEMQNSDGTQRKLVIFTEHVATLKYLIIKLRRLFPHPDAIVTIHGGVHPRARRQVEHRFRNDPNVLILVATDAAGEGINLQCANLMINYDLPWNPNRLEQRFGRIHRIGQTEVCHLWNLVASKTREGAVYSSLLSKMENMNIALQGRVFDVLGELYSEISLKKLLVKAIRYGDDPETRAKLEEAVENSIDQQRVSELLRKQALVTETMDLSKIPQLRADLEAAQKRRLQLADIKSFFFEAFQFLDGKIRELNSEPGRFAIKHVPAEIRSHARDREMRSVREEYRRICFEKELIYLPNKVEAEFICPGHPLLDVIVSLILERERDVLKRGAILVDDKNINCQPRVLFYLQQEILDATKSRDANQRAVSREIHYLELDRSFQVIAVGHAPYLDYRPACRDEQVKLLGMPDLDFLNGDLLEDYAVEHAVEHLVPPHLERVRSHRVRRIRKIEAAICELRRQQALQYQREQVELREWREKIEQAEQEKQAADKRRAVYSNYSDDEKARALENLGVPKIIQKLEQQELFQDQEWYSERDELSEREELEYWEYQMDVMAKQRRLLEDQLQHRERELERERQIYAAQPIISGGALIVPAKLLE